MNISTDKVGERTVCDVNLTNNVKQQGHRPRLWEKITFLLIFLYIFLFITLINFQTPLIGEDFALSIPYSNKDDGFVKIISLVGEKIYYQSTTWNARLGEQLTIIILAFDKVIFNVLNIFLTFAFFYLIIVYSKGEFVKVSSSYFYFIALMLSIFLLLPNAGDILFWITVASNYLWSVLILLLFFLPYRLLFSGKDILTNSPVIFRILLIPLAVLAGMTNENTVIAVLTMLIVAYIATRKGTYSTISIPKWYWPNFSLLLIGYGYLFLSPSTKIRREYFQKTLGIQNDNLFSYFTKAVNIFKQYISFSKNLLFVLIFTVLIFTALFLLLMKWYHWKLQSGNFNNLIISAFTAGGSFVSVAVLIAAPYFESRTLLFNWFFLLVLLLTFVNEIYSRKSILLVLTVPILLIGLIQTPVIYNCSSQLSGEAKAREKLILTQINNGSMEITVDRFKTDCPNIFSNREDWLILFGHDEVYYNVKDIRILKP